MSISKQMQTIAKEVGLQFTFRGSPVSHEEVFSEEGLLPGLAKRSDQVAQLTFGYGLGITFENNDGLLLGKRVKFDDYTPEAVRLLCLLDQMMDIAKNASSKSAVPLDELLYD
jgi:intracellular multiplication protein IcmS